MSENHVASPRLYLLVFASLMVLTFMTVAASRYDFGPGNTVVAMAIAPLLLYERAALGA